MYIFTNPDWMPNTFAPRAFSNVVKKRTQELRREYARKHSADDRIHKGDVKEWHAMVDLLSDGAKRDFVSEYSNVDSIPEVVDVPRSEA